MPAPARIETEARVRGAIYGLLIGDALGVPYEFSAASELPPSHRIEMEPPAGFRRAHSGTPVGTWSDDGAQALHLLNVLLAEEGDDNIETRLARALLSWQASGALTPDGRVFDVGAQTQRALVRIHAGWPPEKGPAEESSNGNGSLMRCLPAALIPAGHDRDYVERARRQSLPTHAHPRSQLACALSTLVGVRLLSGASFGKALEQAQGSLRSITPRQEHDELDLLLAGQNTRLRGSGYVVDCFWSAAHAVMTTGSYEDCVRAAIALGEDTDTTACVAGGWAGLLYGEDAIPLRWREQLRGKSVVEPMIVRLMRMRTTGNRGAPLPTGGTQSSLLRRFAKLLKG